MEEGMGRHFTAGITIFVCALFLGCATQNGGNKAGEDLKVEYIRGSYKPVSVPENDPHTGQKLVTKAKSAIGTPYVYGGSAPGGFDCSGLVKWAYNSVGVTLPRTAREQSVVGEKVGKVEDMRAGDIVAFRHPKRGYHTGIYVGDGKFIHSPRRRTHVRINSLSDPYFSKTLLGARRVNMAAGENLVAQASERLDKMIAETTNLTISAKNVRARKAQKADDLLAAKSKKTARAVAAKSRKAGKISKATVASKKGAVAKKAASKGKLKASKTNVASKNKATKASKSVAANTKTKNASKTVASNAQTKKSTGKAAVKKQTGKTVSMLTRKSPKPALKRKHS